MVDTHSVLQCPDERLLALALVVVRSKPDDRLDIGEYIRLLRQHIAKGRRENALSSVHHHLDRSSYWRAEYERSQSALVAAESNIVDLSRQIGQLKSEADAAKATSTTKKRKTPDENNIPFSPRPSRRPRRRDSPEQPSSASRGELDNGFIRAGEIGNILNCSLFHIVTALRSQGDIDLANVVYHVIRTASSLQQVIDYHVKSLSFSDPSRTESSLAVFNLANRAVAILFAGLSRLENTNRNEPSHGRVIFAVVQMFQNLMATLEHLVAAEVTQLQDADPCQNLRVRTSLSKAKSKQAHIKARPVSASFAGFLVEIIKQLDPTIRLHNSIYEGFAYCVLEKLGTELFTAAFGHAREPTMEAEILRSLKGVDSKHADALSLQQHQDDQRQKQLKLAAPHLVTLLEHVMTAAPAHLGSRLDESSIVSQPPVGSHSSGRDNLSFAALERLQKTLVNSVFGVEGLGPHNPLRNCLQLPLAPEETLPIPKARESSITEWFAEEVWRLLGWEVLTSYSAF